MIRIYFVKKTIVYYIPVQSYHIE